MSLKSYLDDVQLMKAGPGVAERLERWIAAAHHKAVIRRLRRFRKQLEADMSPQSWVILDAPAVLLLLDVCAALGLNDEEQAEVLGRAGERRLAEFLESRPVYPPQTLLNERQAKALAHIREHGGINLGALRQRCPGWSDETLRLDPADLVRRGLLKKTGAKRGTYYTRQPDAEL